MTGLSCRARCTWLDPAVIGFDIGGLARSFFRSTVDGLA